MNNKISMSELLPIILEAFDLEKSFKINITGTSMKPLLIQGRDYVEIVKPHLPLNVGDIPLYRRDDGSFVLHRVVAVNEDGYVMCGDNQYVLESGIKDSQIIGVVKTICRDGRKFDVQSDEWYKKYTEKCLKKTVKRYPWKRFKNWIKMKLR
ncbi:MAG: S24/S26 family peptidase [Acutalibacteraceae bacterium]